MVDSSTADPGWFRRLLRVIRPHGRYAVLALLGAALGNVALVATPIVTRRLIDHAIVRHDGTLDRWVLILVGLTLFRAGATFLRRWFGGQVSINVEADLRRSVHDHLQTLDPATHDALSQGQVVSRANTDVGMISQLLAFLPFLSGNVVQLVLSLVAMAFLSPILLGVVDRKSVV